MSEPNESADVFGSTMDAGPISPEHDAPDGVGPILGVGADSPIGAPRKSRVSNGSLILLLTVVVAAGVLTIMRRFSMGTGLALLDMTIDYPIDAPRTTDIDESHRVIAQLRDSALAVQVPLEEVKKNPFEFSLDEPSDALRPAPSTRTVSQAELDRQRRALRIKSTFDSLTLNSVVAGAVPIARVSGENVRVGDTIQGLFVVQSIHGRTVELTADGEVYTLTMGH